MARYDNTFEGGTNGSAITVTNSGGTSGTAWGAIVANGAGVTSSANIIYSSTAAQSGSLGCRITLDASSSYLRVDADTTMTNRVFFRLKTTYPGPATSSINTMAVLMAGTVRTVSLVVGTDGKPFFTLTNSGTYFAACKPSTALTAGSKYTFEIVVGKATAAGNTDGELGFRILDSAGTVIHTYSGTGNTGIADYTAVRFGGATNTLGWTTLDIDDTSFGDLASGWPTAITSTSTTVSVINAIYYVSDFRASTSGGGNTLTFSIAWTSGANHASGIVVPVSGLFLIPQDSSSTSVYTVTVVDGANNTTQQVTVPSGSSSGAADSIIEYYWNGSAWV